MTLKTSHLYKGPFDHIKIGLCQIHSEEWAIKDNYRRTLASIEQAAQKGADIAVTPECVLLGYPVGQAKDFQQRLYHAAETIGSQRIQTFQQKAKSLNIFLLLGFAERSGGQLYNSAAFISNTGKLLYVYRKVHCRDFESIEYNGFFTPGREFTTASVEMNNRPYSIGTMICFDREIPESVRCLRAMGSELILCPLATNTRQFTEKIEQSDNEMITQCRAAENEVYIAVVNHAGRFNGGSFIVGPSGEVVHQMNEHPGVDVIKVPLKIICKRFHADPLGWMGWGYRKPDVYKNYL